MNTNALRKHTVIYICSDGLVLTGTVAKVKRGWAKVAFNPPVLASWWVPVDALTAVPAAGKVAS